MQLDFLRYRHLYYIFSGSLVLISIAALLFFGLSFGIEFRGGSILEVEYENARPSNQEIRERLSDLNLGGIVIQPADELGMILRMKDIDEETHQAVLDKIGGRELRFESVGPVIGKELKEKVLWAVILAVAVIIIYIALAFRRSSRPVASWQYGLITSLVAFHDALIPLGLMAVLGKWQGTELTIPIIAALLTVIGYSINDTIVVFDRIRENILRHTGVSFEDTVNKSLNQTLVRSVNTSLTTLLVLLAIFFFGGITLKYFSLVLIVGIVAGTYSSIFLAAPLLVSLYRRT